MIMLFIEHTLKEGERLDIIADKYWGDTNLTPILMLDNLQLPCVREIPVGIKIYVRESIDDETITNLQDLPPWR